MNITDSQRQAYFLWKHLCQGEKDLQEAHKNGDVEKLMQLTADCTFWRLEWERLVDQIGLLAIFSEEE
ncbi:hypothetical protein [Marininema halotolerans]|uniref:Uncharacterized protein n=1 Tax=Marininema halotolerans TaxID=1155944 RepID=A0A1I6RXI1_9BACL|nr:hypothetical protein [Marininema halotolerans]SFS69409.1 hypothetical protein SAMN05444972_10616 [Marininema halotolerans]